MMTQIDVLSKEITYDDVRMGKNVLYYAVLYSVLYCILYFTV